MKVLHVYATYYPDRTSGVAECMRQLGLGLQGTGAGNRIFALSPRPNSAPASFKEGEVYRAKSWGAPASCDIGALDALRQYRLLCAWADIVHHHMPWPFGDLLHLVSGNRKPLVVTWHSDVVRQQVLGAACAPLRNALLRRARAVIATSPAYAETSRILSKKDVAPKVRVIPPGVLDNSNDAPDAASVAVAAVAKVREPFFLFLGALRYYKGLPFLIRAARESGVTVVIAGEGDVKSLQRLAAGASNVVFTGHVSDDEKRNLLRACRALVLPSHLRSEAYGMVLVEAAMCGKPMISCEIGTGTSFVNRHNETGLVVEPGSSEALAAAMRRLAKDDTLCQTFGRAARTRYKKLFDARIAAEAHLRLYSEIVPFVSSNGSVPLPS